ncbi:MAG: hypothetical protein D6805_02395 [Planctomycetota bacterium]|nr:MAG: hypothetical protein D6805_02395 [Planctomycetota bacterium]
MDEQKLERPFGLKVVVLFFFFAGVKNLYFGLNSVEGGVEATTINPFFARSLYLFVGGFQLLICLQLLMRIAWARLWTGLFLLLSLGYQGEYFALQAPYDWHFLPLQGRVLQILTAILHMTILFYICGPTAKKYLVA